MNPFMIRLQKWLPRKRLDIFGKDSLLKTSLPYYILTILPIIGLYLQKPNPYVFIVLTYAGFPFLDEIFSLDGRNPTNKQRIQLQKNDPYFRMTLYSAIILSWATLFRSFQIFSMTEINIENIPYLIGYIFIVSNFYAAQFSVTHEIMHKPGSFYKFLATFHMWKLYYPHFTHHHLFKHHYEVGTPSDPSTARRGESVYQFIIRCIIDSWKAIYYSQKNNGKSIITNFAILSIFASIIFASIVYYFYGFKVMVLHSIMALGSVIYLQAINYIQHYGLMRKLLPNGQYQKVTILHSWNAPHRFTNYFFFKLQRHSDHHQNSSKPFQTLISLDQSPFLPHGYTLMILMSFFPSIWFNVMDPLAAAYSQLSIDEVNPQNKKIQICEQIKEKAITKTRIFLLKITFATIILMAASLFFGF